LAPDLLELPTSQSSGVVGARGRASLVLEAGHP
jgi:hypothetical protein